MTAHVDARRLPARALPLACAALLLGVTESTPAQTTSPAAGAQVEVRTYATASPDCLVGGLGVAVAVLAPGDCAIPNLISAGQASVDPSGALRARAFISSSGILPPPIEIGGNAGLRVVQVVGSAFLYDVLVVNGLPAGSRVSFLGELTGTTSVNAAPPTEAIAFSSYGMQWWDAALGRYTAGYFDLPNNLGSHPYRANPLIFPLVNGSNYFGIFLAAAADLSNDLERSGIDVPLIGTAEADYARTGRITAVRVLDAQGNGITARVTLSFASGASYGVAVVPEPGTWALLGTGLLALGAVTRRRVG
jgi:hypothetical protein